MPYDPIRDSYSESPTIPSRSASAGLSMLLNHDTPPSPSLPKKRPRFDPVHFPDNPSSPSVETPRPSSSSSSTSGYLTTSYFSSPAMSGLALPKPQLGNLHINLPPDPSRRSLTSSPPIFDHHPSSSTPRSPYVSPVLHQRPLSVTSVPPPNPTPPPVRLLYQPRSRVSVEKSVLVPISPEELQDLIRRSRNSLRHPPSPGNAVGPQGGTGGYGDHSDRGEGPSTDVAPWSPSRPTSAAAYNQYPSQNDPVHSAKKRQRSPEDGGDHERVAHPAIRTSSALVASHYNARPDVGKVKREESPIIGLKNFNNWIKAVMIAKFARPAIRETNSRVVTTGRRPKYIARVLDLGCGKGGDLIKWGKADIAAYVGIDIAEVSIQQARSRLLERRKLFEADFFDLDCFSYPLTDKVPLQILSPFDVVSMQFCMHYAFETEDKVRMMLTNVTKYLRPGGIFLGTTPNSKHLLRRLKKLPDPDPNDPQGGMSFGNSVYNIRFASRHGPGKGTHPYGHQYWFWLKDAVDNVPEWIVRWDSFVTLAEEFGLEVVYKEEFHTIYEQEQNVPEFKSLLQTMRVVDSKGESYLDQDQWEAANIYVGFVFKKRTPSA